MTDAQKDALKKETLAAKYEDEMQRRRKKLKDRLSDGQYAFFTSRSDNTPIYAELAAAMKNPGTVPSKYLSEKMKWLFDSAVSSRDRDVILYFADRLREYPYSDSCVRRSLRAQDNGVYAEKLASIISDYGTNLTLIDEPVEKILNRSLPEDAQAFLDENALLGCGYTCWQAAYALDSHDVKAEEAVHRILTEKNSSNMMTAELIRGILLSHRNEFHELLGKLFLAARLQEGLRQAICENADCGTKSGFLTILKVIDENNLIRFSSVKRAVGTWLGILPDESRDLERVSEKSVRLITECIGSDSIREEFLASEDAMKIYVALWSMGLDDVDPALEKIEDIADRGSIHQLLVAGYFTANLDLPCRANRIAKTVLKKHSGNEEILAVWLPCFMPLRFYALWHAVSNNRPIEYGTWFESPEEISEFEQLFNKIYAGFTGKARTFSPCVFPWYEAKTEKSDLAEILCTLAAVSKDNGKIDEACGLIRGLNANQRELFLSTMLKNPQTAVQRKTLLEGLADKDTYTRESVYKTVSGLNLSAEEYRFIEDELRFKGADIRQNIINLLLKQSGSELISCIERLLKHKKEEVRLGGLDMLMQLKKDGKRSNIADSFNGILLKMAEQEDISSKEKILLDSLAPKKPDKKAEEITLDKEENKYLPDKFDERYIRLCAKTFSEYFPASGLPEMLCGKKGEARLFGRIKSVLTGRVVCKSAVTAAEDLKSLSDYIKEHETDSFLSRTGKTMLIGTVKYQYQFQDKDGKLPFTELWRKWKKTNGITDKRLVNMLVMLCSYLRGTEYAEACRDTIKTVFGKGFEYAAKPAYSGLIRIILNYLLEFVPEKELTQLASALAAWFIRCVPDDMVMIGSSFPKGTAHLLAHRQLSLVYGWLTCKNNADLKNTFPLAVASAERCLKACEGLPRERRTLHYNYAGSPSARVLRAPDDDTDILCRPFVGVNAYIYAGYHGIITEAQLLDFLLNKDSIFNAMRLVSAVAVGYYERNRQISDRDWYKSLYRSDIVNGFLKNEDGSDNADMKLIRYVLHIYEKVIPIVVGAEMGRGDSPAAYTEGIPGILRIYGAEYFAGILSALGDDPLDRMVDFGFVISTSRKNSLSRLLAACIPADGDSEDTLRKALAGKKITAKRLIEAAFFSPEWIPIVGKYLNIASFESVCYYFMAHMDERFDEKRLAVIAKYTPLSDDELNLGVCDVNWLRVAHDSVSEKEFDLIYGAAKYISDGVRHTRARKYADAALGKLDEEKTEKEISGKRNKDLLMAYPLIPLKSEEDIRRRYLFIQKFRKESRRFGPQRAASEEEAANAALTNLALNAGYRDALRLILRMEAKISDGSPICFEEQTVEDVSFKIKFDDNGKAALEAVKDGKELKSIPAKLKKAESVRMLTDTVKNLSEQYRRTRLMLERAMEDGTRFTFSELSALLDHPVVSPMLKKLVFTCGDFAGFITDNGLVSCGGKIQSLDSDSEIKIAHPFDLYQKGCWKDYQKYLFENKIVQPFRQVFRELYVKTAEEAHAFRSLRYAGNQIQPAKTIGVLKDRRWVADIEDGLQKVYYKENIVAQIYAVADWFSPADIEAPTLEWVCFTDRKTGDEIKISDIPDVIFSEVMRDVDLAVSAAHAGGVDPETSHSTMEMREAILSYILPMFRIENVKTDNGHAIIQGRLAKYSVHLGSGVVHQLGGTMIPVLPVHSQHKGRIFLPFIDDDPKTAEIISEILLFAEDEKIKDPMILSNIRR